MKSEHRHELETNWLAHHTAIWLERLQPYNSLIVGGLIVAAIALFAYSFFSGESAARQSEAWNSYNEAVSGVMPNLETLRKSSGEYPDSPMQEFADITWADGQMWLASRYYIQNRAAAEEAANRAVSTYQTLLSETQDDRVRSRAHFGLARVYELQNELDKAREEYGKVEGGFKLIADQRIEQLEKPETKEVYAWLATAKAPPRTAPTGPGTPGVSPGFAPGEIELPAASGDAASGEAEPGVSIDDLFQGIGETPANTESNTDRYDEGESKPADDDAKAADGSNAGDDTAAKE